MKRIFWLIVLCIASYAFFIRTHAVQAVSCPSGNVWSITDFGANGNDTLDDYDALLKASQCASNRENITLYFPVGHYYINEYRIIGVTKDGRQPNGVQNIIYNNCKGLRIIGAGQDRTVIDVKGNYHMTADKEGYDGVEGHDLSYSMNVIPFFFNMCSGVYLGGFELDGNFDQTIVAPSIFQPHTNMGVFIHGSSNFTLANINVHHFAEDGVYLGGGNIDKDGLIYNVDSHHNGRQGMSITNARGVTVVNSSFTWTGFGNSKFFLPGCGIDVEPDREYQNPSDSTNDDFFINIHLAHNRGNPDPEDVICVYNPAAHLHFGTLHLYNPTTIFQEIDYFVNNTVDHNNDTDISALVTVVTSLTMNELQNSWLVSGDVTINLKTSDIKTIKYSLDSSPITEVVPASQKIIIHTGEYTNGRHYLSAVATDTSNQTVDFNPITLVFINLPEATPVITPTPTPTGTVQGCKVLSRKGCYDPANAPFTLSGASVSLDGINATNLGNSAPNSYNFGATSGTHIVTATAPTGYKVIGYTLCYNRTDCHQNTPTPGSSVSIDVPADGYADLWWHFTIPGDIWGKDGKPDGKVDMYDFNKMVADFGHPYTIFDYNVLVGNFGK